MRIGKLAALAGVTSDTIRYYEREGLLPTADRTPGGYRDYGPEVVDDLRFIKKGQASGLKLNDIREVMQIAEGGRPPCEHIRATVTARLAEVEGRLRELRSLRSTLKATLTRLDGAPTPKAGCRCAVIEASGV
jgi:MerR family transcriptional regulator, Zn(II)-responsive regulator of zntA